MTLVVLFLSVFYVKVDGVKLFLLLLLLLLLFLSLLLSLFSESLLFVSLLERLTAITIDSEYSELWRHLKVLTKERL